ncbi:YjeF N-terminal domain-containing protein [Lipomyces chichibuensis]|uniref:YjeF N-terminal domain-containing protein n=1 Tax=Lipomyces chichibuensis TaxID=1546026 RepID=UPI003344117E
MAASRLYLSAKGAAALDAELMSSGGFSLDQLMELAGLSCAQAVYKSHPPESKRKVLIIAGPGNNGGDGLVAARHLKLFGYNPMVYYPKRPNKDLYNRLVAQLSNLKIPFTDDIDMAITETDQILDAIFGFSFQPPIRDPFVHVIGLLELTKKPVTSVDIPSSWDVELGPPRNEELGAGFVPDVLVSLTAPKPAAKFFKGTHFLGGRFVSRDIAEKWGFSLPDYPGVDQVVELPVDNEKL